MATDIDSQNSEFWDELCGSQIAKALGVEDSSPESLQRFDDWYFSFYPYLSEHIPFIDLAGKDVLEVGLGYGTVAQRLAESGANYTGLDIADGPVQMVNQRLRQNELNGQAFQDSIHAAPFENESFDWIIAIGCFHHTGDISRALEESRRVLRKGGEAVIMMYSAYSYRRWLYNTFTTIKFLLWDKMSLGAEPESTNQERKHYDHSSSGVGAPATQFISKTLMQRLTREWANLEVQAENIGQEFPFLIYNRDRVNKRYGHWLGLDLYCRLVK
jgi:SAM-dependent methyltransferase